MDKWRVLGIEATTDKLKIKEAYMEKLSSVHPEEDPDGFKLLRATYDELIDIASKEIDIEDHSPIGLWMNKIKKIYNTFSLRLSSETWKEVLNDAVCFAIDTKEDACNSLLEFLLESYYLPQSIWALIDDSFDIRERENELSESFPHQFISYAINEINYGDSLNYDLFEIDDNKDYEAFIELYFDIRRLLAKNEVEEIEFKINEMKELDISHPYFIILEIRYFLLLNNLECAKHLADALVEKLPDDIQVLSTIAEVEWSNKAFEKAKEYYESVLKIAENHYDAKTGLADCNLELGDYIEAKKLYRELNNINPYDDYIRNKIYDCNEKIIEVYYKDLEEKPEDSSIKFNLSWTLFENFRYEDAIKVANDFVPEEKSQCEYYDLMGRLYTALKNHEKALSYFELWVSKIEKETADGTLDEELSRSSYAYFQKGRILEALNRYEESLGCYNIALEKEPDEAFYLNYKAEVLNKLKRYEESISISDRSIEIEESQAGPYINRGNSYYELGYYQEAMDDANTAINIYPYFTESYLIKIKIHDIYSNYQDMIDIINEVERLEIVTDNMNMYKVRSLSHLENIDEAKKLGMELIDKAVKGEICDDTLISEIHYEMAMIMMCEDNPKQAMEYINVAIKSDPSDLRNKSYKAYIYKETKDFNAALKHYNELIDLSPKNTYSYIQIGIIYDEIQKFDDAIAWYKKALEIDPHEEDANLYISDIYERLGDEEKSLDYISRQIEIKGSEYSYIHRGIMYASKGLFNEALSDYNEALRIKPESKYAYNNIGCLYKDNEKQQEAIDYYVKAIELDTDNSFVNSYNNIADCFIDLKDYDKAFEYYNLGMNVMPQQDSLYSNKGLLLKKIGRYNEAIEEFKKAIELDDKNTEYLENIAETYEFIGCVDRAYNYYLKIVELNPSHSQVYDRLARIETEKKQYKKAIEFMKKQIKVDPDEYEYQIKLGKLYKLCGKKISANSTLKKALKKYLSKSDLTACDYCEIGGCYAALDNKIDASIYLDKAIKGAKTCSTCKHELCYESYIQYGLMAEEEKNIAEALEYFKKAIHIKGEEDIDCVYAIKRLS